MILRILKASVIYRNHPIFHLLQYIRFISIFFTSLKFVSRASLQPKSATLCFCRLFCIIFPHKNCVLIISIYFHDKGSNFCNMILTYRLKLSVELCEPAQQSTKNRNHSSWEEILFGILQGSIFGLLSCNLLTILEEIDFVIYAEDNTPLVFEVTPEYLVNSLKICCDTLFECFF